MRKTVPAVVCPWCGESRLATHIRVHQSGAICAGRWAAREGLIVWRAMHAPVPDDVFPLWARIVVKATGSAGVWSVALRRGFADEEYRNAVLTANDLGGPMAVAKLVEGEAARRKRLAREAADKREREARNLYAGLLRAEKKLKAQIREARDKVRYYDRQKVEEKAVQKP